MRGLVDSVIGPSAAIEKRERKAQHHFVPACCGDGQKVNLWANATGL